jgi:hypothetical protein
MLRRGGVLGTHSRDNAVAESFCFFVVITGVKHLRGRYVEPASGRGVSSGKMAKPLKYI